MANRNQFDLRVHIRDKNGRISQKQPYRLKVVDGQRRYERPVGSGKWHYENGELIDMPKPVEAAKPVMKPVPKKEIAMKEHIAPKAPMKAPSKE